jgi:hypothetical protein
MAKVKITITPLKLNDAQKLNRASRKGAIVVLAMQKDRLFGESANGFGNYKSKEYLLYRLKKYKRTNTNINFTLSGEMQAQYVVGFNSPNYTLGFNAIPNGSKNPNAPEKAKQLEKRFDNLFDLTREEEEVFATVFENEYFK